MPPCARSGTASGSTRFSGSNKLDPTLAAVMVKGLKLFGAHFDLEQSSDCERLVKLYKECVMDDLVSCGYYLMERPKDCPEFNKGEFLRSVSSSNSTSNG